MSKQSTVHRTRRSLLTIAIALVGLLIGGGTTAAAAEVQDAACLASSGVYLQPSMTSTRLAETFTALQTGGVTRAQFSIYKQSGSTGDYALDVRTLDGSGLPTENVLASTAISDGSVPNGQSIISGMFSAPASIVAGQRYALAVSRPGGSQIAIEVNQTNPCSDGQLFTSPGSGSAWTITGGGNYDARFAVFVTPPSTTSTPPALTITGLRAAALKRCKKRAQKHDWSKERLKKCKEKARLLPV
jgi:hypothetical protein